MSENIDKLKKLLIEMFQLDQADLDFGIYRIMNQKRDEIKNFMEKDLLPEVKNSFESYKVGDSKTKFDELENLKRQLEDAGVKPESSPKYVDLKNQINTGIDELSLENDVFSHLVTFFSRYYKEGDFLSLRRYKKDTYAIPYNGEEVKLHWANSDQYYIKTTENFRDYCFKTDDGKRIHFKLVEASTENDNNKSQDRRFVLCEEGFIGIEDNELIIKFEYKPHTEKRERLNEMAYEKLKKVITPTNEYKDFHRIFAPAPTKKDNSRTLIQKQINDYTSKNEFDYFIHKDLGGFLRCELDFYIKNEVVFVDDWGTDKDLNISISKVKVIKNIAEKIIRFLEQLENFQKKLWLKKKFVTETNYCLTLDKVPETLYGEISINTAQIEEWKRLFAIDDIDGFDGVVNEAFLKANPYLVIDTIHFDRGFVEEVISTFNNLDEELNGLLIHSENFQALNLLQEKYKQKVKCVYIDPPYNTNTSEIIYKNGYKHSSWFSLIYDRMMFGNKLATGNAIFLTAIDYEELFNLGKLKDNIYGEENRIGIVTIQHNPKGRNQAKFFSENSDYMLVYCKDIDNAQFNQVAIDEDVLASFSLEDENGKYRYENYIRARTIWSRKNKPKNWYPIYVSKDLNHITSEYNENYYEIYPNTKQGDFSWKNIKETFDDLNKNKYFKAIFEDNGIKIFHKLREQQVLKNVWIQKKYQSEFNGTNLVKDIIGIGYFDYPKSIYTIIDVIKIVSCKCDYILDYFAGSGTTAHAVINLNREDEGDRKYILVEMGNYFDTVLKPRIQKVIYSKDWKDGKPVSREGSSHFFKYICLESYEDTLNNLIIKKPNVSLADMKGFKEDYLLSYMLDVETRESDSLLNIDKFKDPFSYKLNIERNGETKQINVDLIETFNYLIGLTVKRIEKTQRFDLETDTKKLIINNNGKYIFRELDGILPNGEKALIIWRRLTDDISRDNYALNAFFVKKGYNPIDFEYDTIFVNGDNNLQNLKEGEERWKVVMIEEEFKKKMFDVKAL
ncbi:MAG: site-specific DNA-methyltransferase [Nitrospirae bacterium]|nr:site-specific DNA-methyltransferase [Nitrospirota bacterium]